MQIRTADEFTGRGQARRSPRLAPTLGSWTLERIRAARDAQLAGNFGPAAQLAAASKTDSAIFPAFQNRMAPISALSTELTSRGGVRGEAVRRKALDGVTASASVLRGMGGTMADHGIAIGRIIWSPDEDGTRVDMRLEEWPIAHVQYDSSQRCLTTAVEGESARVPIIHGNGDWIIASKSGPHPWMTEACLLPIAFLWAAHAEGMADWAGGSRSHGSAKIIGSPAEGEDTVDENGVLTERGSAFLQLLADLASGAEDVGVIPAGAKTEFLSNSSTAWQIWKELILSLDKSAARIYQGTDAALGSVGGAPGVDIATLFGVTSTIVEGDTSALSAALNTGLYDVWAAVNIGDSRLAPRFGFVVPNADDAGRREETRQNWKRLTDTIVELRAAGLAVDQGTVAALCRQFDISPIPVLNPQPPAARSGADGS